MVNGTNIKVSGKQLLLSKTPLSVSVKNNTVEIISNKKGTCAIAGKKFKYKAGTTTHLLQQPLLVAGINEELNNIASKKESKPQQQSSWKPEIAINTNYSPGRELITSDIDSDGTSELLVCSGKALQVYSLDGTPLWSYQNETERYSVAAADIDSNGTVEILVGTNDTTVLILDPAGTLIDIKAIPIEQSGSYGTRSDLKAITQIKIHDIDKDGDPEIFLGMEAWQIQMYDHTFKRLWHFVLIYHGVTGIDFADMNGDGIEEIIASDRYGSVRVLDWKNKNPLRSIKTYTAISDALGVVVDIDGDGIKELLNACDSGRMTMFKRPEKAKLKEEGGSDGYWSYDEVWQFNNYGFGFKDLAIGSTTTGEAILAASETGYIYSIDPKTSQTNWMTHLNSNVIKIKALDDNSILAGTTKGNLYHLNQNGQIHKQASLNSPAIRIIELQQDQAVVLDNAGYLNILNIGIN
jgi:outer membrane protein assembly factor BamB